MLGPFGSPASATKVRLHLPIVPPKVSLQTGSTLARTIGADKALAVGLVSQVVGENHALDVARRTAAQLGKFDRVTAAAAKAFIKPIPYEELRREIDLFCELFTRDAVFEGLRKFVENTGPMPYLP